MGSYKSTEVSTTIFRREAKCRGKNVLKKRRDEE
jgi:hypothetical protein